jgi:diguanylate cyclase (GGDEF)-like protein
MAEMNNRHGHAACGHVLHALAKLLQARVRATALVARWGGEEFLALLPDTPPAGAHEMAEQLRLAVQNTPFCWQQATVPVKVSVGAATWSSGPFHANALTASADRALCQATRPRTAAATAFAWRPTTHCTWRCLAAMQPSRSGLEVKSGPSAYLESANSFTIDSKHRQEPMPAPAHSCRSASIGSMRAARRAGK